MKKKLRTLLSLLLVFCLVFVQGSITVNAGVIYGAVDDYYADVFNEEYQVYDNLMWKYDHINNELIVGGKGAMPDFTVGNRPWEEYWDKALKVTIVGDLTTVGKYAFANFYSLEVLRFMADITTIQAYAFSDCPELYTIHMPPSVKTIAGYAFMNSTNVWAIHYEGTSTEAASINLTTNTFLKNKFYCNHYRGVNLVVIENVKIEYQTGEAFYADVYGCSDDGKLSSRISNYQVKNFDTTTPGTQTVLVGYNGYFKEFVVNVYGEPIEPEIVFENVQTEYAIGEAFYAEVYEYCGEVVNKIPLADCIIDGFDNSIEGYQTVSITYNDYTEFFKVYVYAIETEYNFEWSFDEGTRELYIFGDGEMPDFIEYSAPWRDFAPEIRTVIIDGHFMNISPGAFMGCYELDTVIIRSEVEMIQTDAFADCHNLSMIYIPLSVRHIECNAFRHDDNIIGVYYQGSEEDWNYINCEDRYILAALDIYFNCDDFENRESVVVENVKTEYQFGEYFYAEVYVTDADGNRFMVEDYEVIGYDRHNPGWQTVTVRYGDYSEDFEVYVMEMTDVRNEYTLVVENPVTEYEYGDEFYAEVYIHNNFGDSMQIEDYEVIGFDSYTQGRQTVTIKFEHLEQKIEVYVNGVGDETYIESVELMYAKRSYYPGDEFYAELLVRYADGKEEIVTDFEVEGFDSYNPCAQKVLIKYGEYELYTTVRVYPASEAPQIIELTLTDLNTEYYIGDELQVQVIGVKDDGSSVAISLEECEIEGFDNTTPGEQIVTVTYGGLSVEFGVIVYDIDEPDVPEIPEVVDFRYIKTEYEFGEEFYAEIYVIDANGEQFEAEYYVEGFDSYMPGWQTVTVSYNGYSQVYKVYVYDRAETERYVVSVELVNWEVKYYPGDEFDGELLVIYSDGTEEYTRDYILEGFDSYTPGAQKVLIRYGQNETYVTVRVYPASEAPQIIELTLTDLNTEYYIGDELQVQVIGVKDDGSSVAIGLEECEIEGFDNTTPGEQIVTVTYGGLSVEFGVTVYDIDEPDVPEIPEVVDFRYVKTEYEFGEEFYAEIYVIDANGEQFEAEYYVEGFDSYMPGWQTVTVIYKDQCYTCDVYVNEQQPQIVDVDFEVKHNFEYGEEFSATAVVYYDDGTVKRVKTYEVEGYDPYAPGEQAVTIIYGEYSVSLIVSVGYEQPQVTVNYVKTEYEYGEDFYAEVQVSYKGETTDVYDYKVTGFDSYSPGVQNVTISYLNYREVFTVVINEPAYVEPEIRPVVSVSSERCRAGNTVDVVISLSENTGFANLGLEISYDTAMTLVGVTANSNVGATFTKAQSLDVYPYNIGWDSVSNNNYNGELVTLTFEIPEDMCAGEYYVDVDFYKGRNGDYTDGVSVNYDENENPLFLEYNSGCITVFDYIPGDINGDGTVTNKDGTALLRYLAGWELENIIEEALDVDGDGAITNKDGTRLLRYLANWDVEIF